MSFWAGRRVLVTGHTGFKGSWLCEVLLARGAVVAGLALAPDTRPALFDQLGLAHRMDHALGDIRDAALVAARLREVRPEVVLHLAAQPLVRRSYREPLETWATNVMGTAHVLEGVRALEAPCAVVVVTTDDEPYVAEPDEAALAFEADVLDALAQIKNRTTCLFVIKQTRLCRHGTGGREQHHQSFDHSSSVHQR